MTDKNGLEDFKDLIEFANQGIIEKTSVCPQCGKEINVFIEKYRLSILCKHCGHSRSTIIGSAEK